MSDLPLLFVLLVLGDLRVLVDRALLFREQKRTMLGKLVIDRGQLGVELAALECSTTVILDTV